MGLLFLDIPVLPFSSVTEYLAYVNDPRFPRDNVASVNLCLGFGEKVHGIREIKIGEGEVSIFPPLEPLKASDNLLAESRTNDAGRNATDYLIRGHVFRNDGANCNYGPITYGYTTCDPDVLAYPNIIANRYGPWNRAERLCRDINSQILTNSLSNSGII